MDHSSSSFYSILIEPLKLAPKIAINDITSMRHHGSFSNSSEPSLEEIHCDWDKGFCKNWSSSFNEHMIFSSDEKKESKNCFRLGKILRFCFKFLIKLIPLMKSYKASVIFSIRMISVKQSQLQDIVIGDLGKSSHTIHYNRFHILIESKSCLSPVELFHPF